MSILCEIVIFCIVAKWIAENRQPLTLNLTVYNRAVELYIQPKSSPKSKFVQTCTSSFGDSRLPINQAHEMKNLNRKIIQSKSDSSWKSVSLVLSSRVLPQSGQFETRFRKSFPSTICRMFFVLCKFPDNRAALLL